MGLNRGIVIGVGEKAGGAREPTLGSSLLKDPAAHEDGVSPNNDELGTSLLYAP
jgi:hypothetical protein